MAIPRFKHLVVGTLLEECIQAPSADLLTAELHGRIASAVSEASEAFTAEVSMVEPSTAAAGDKGENDEHTSKIE
jgi:hypothetical protein